jgi:hypothetical protein
MAYKIFISYATKDLPTANHLKRLLTDASVEVYVAAHSLWPGAIINTELVKAIESCDLFILLWSHNSKASEWVSQEIGIATYAKKTIMPVVLEPNLNLPGFIKDMKYLSVYENPENTLTWLRVNVFERARDKQQKDGLTWLGIGAAVLWLFSRGDE